MVVVVGGVGKIGRPVGIAVAGGVVGGVVLGLLLRLLMLWLRSRNGLPPSSFSQS